MSQIEVTLPDVGEGVTEGEMVKWLVKVGDSVEADQPVAEVMTDKATVEVPTSQAGIVKELKVSEGDVVPIGKVMLVLDSAAGSAKAASSDSKSDSNSATQQEVKSSEDTKSNTSSSAPSKSSIVRPESSSAKAMDVNPPAAESKVLATPSTRRLAREMSVDINELQGSGLSGRVTRDDVMSATGGGGMSTSTTSYTPAAPMSAPSKSRPTLEIPKPAFQTFSSSQEERVALRGVRKKIAANMQMAKHVIPHFTLMDEANVTELVKFRENAKSVGEKYGVKITYLPFVMKALIATSKEFPMFNASIDDAAEEIVYKKYFNLGFAADTPNGLMVPVIHDADHKTILQLSSEITDLATRARDGKLKLEEMKGATITITNIGSVGGSYATPIINHPEVAILGMYKITDKPVMMNGKFRAQKMMNLTITADHRLIDGAVAANFLASFIKKLENPSELMLNMV
jgi:pyruvate dehydrogenase E2 component (dihydrolipoamide acetyltransferase)